MNNPYRSGTADVWYSGFVDDLWVEYKYLARLPTRGVVVPDLSPLQLKWLTDRRTEGRNVAVVVGSPAGGILLRNRTSWQDGVPVIEFKDLMVDRKTMAGALTLLTMGSDYAEAAGYSGTIHLANV